MGEAPEQVHLLEVEAIHQRSVTARFYHLIEKANFEVHTDYGPSGYANLGNGYLARRVASSFSSQISRYLPSIAFAPGDAMPLLLSVPIP
jgi:hypothetical protein